MQTKNYKILIVAPAWVGDIVMSQTLFKNLIRQYGDSLVLDVLAPSSAKGLLLRMPEINEVLVNPFVHGKLGLLSRIRLGLSLRAHKYDQVFVLPNSWKSAIIPLFAKIPCRTGFSGEMRYGLLNERYTLDKRQLPLMIERFCALANHGKKPSSIEYPQLKIDLPHQANLMREFGLNEASPIIAFCPAAEYGPAKRWGEDYFATLADMLAKYGYQTIVLGSDKDRELGERIVKMTTQAKITNLCGKTNLTDAVDLLARAKHVVTNDSGLMHIACAVGVHVVAVYGSTSPEFTPPLSSQAQIAKVAIECSPCYQRTCRYGHYNCLKLVTPEMVLQKINSLN
jgi:heptosyltransferase-2